MLEVLLQFSEIPPDLLGDIVLAVLGLFGVALVCVFLMLMLALLLFIGLLVLVLVGKIKTHFIRRNTMRSDSQKTLEGGWIVRVKPVSKDRIRNE
jgi:arginine exporter protein ArgO